MKVGLLLITHDGLGNVLAETASTILGDSPAGVVCISVPAHSNPDTVFEDASAACSALDSGDGVLVLTDLYGSTPSNIAGRLVDAHNVIVVAGVSVPMLIRVLNYASASLEELAGKAESGARDGIVITREEQAR